MKKIVLGAVLVLFLTVGFGVYYLLSNLDSIVKTAIETYGSEATQTAVRVDTVKISVQDGAGALRGLTIANPQGFSAPQAFSLGEIATQIDLKSLSEEVFVLEHITIKAPQVFFELNNEGKNNLEQLKKNLAASGSTAEQSPAAKDSSASGSSRPEPRIIIRKVHFTTGGIQAKVVPLNKEYDLALPPIEMRNLGGKNGATPSQIAEQVLQVLTDRALVEVKKKGLDQYKAQLEGKVNQRVEEEKQKLGEKAGEKLKGFLGN